MKNQHQPASAGSEPRLYFEERDTLRPFAERTETVSEFPFQPRPWGATNARKTPPRFSRERAEADGLDHVL